LIIAILIISSRHIYYSIIRAERHDSGQGLRPALLVTHAGFRQIGHFLGWLDKLQG
jgi:hypothetical protein